MSEAEVYGLWFWGDVMGKPLLVSLQSQDLEGLDFEFTGPGGHHATVPVDSCETPWKYVSPGLFTGSINATSSLLICS